MRLATPNYFSGTLLKVKERTISNKNYGLKNPNWQETDSLAIHKHDGEVEEESTEEQLQHSGQSGTRTRNVLSSSPAHQLLEHASSNVFSSSCSVSFQDSNT